VNAFKDKSFAARYEGMGDIAEAAFEEYAELEGISYVRYGLDRPPLRVAALPARLRYTPDYLTTDSFVEVQGFGTDQTMKLKLDKWGALHWWSDLHPVQMFFYDSKNDRHETLWLGEVDNLISYHATLDRFPEGKPYFAVPAEVLFET
jgi:hypothetical protein